MGKFTNKLLLAVAATIAVAAAGLAAGQFELPLSKSGAGTFGKTKGNEEAKSAVAPRVAKPMTASIKAVADAASPQFIGVRLEADEWSSVNLYPRPRGVYAFQFDADGSVSTEEVFVNLDENSFWADGGVYIDEENLELHFVSWSSVGALSAAYYCYDIFSWECKKAIKLNDFSMIASDYAVDHTTGSVYGVFRVPMGTDGKYELGIADFSGDTPTRSTIGSIDVNIECLACNNAGKLYGIDDAGVLYAIDKTNAALTRIGDTGVAHLDLYQSATFDPNTDKLYWVAYTYSDSRLLEIDPKTAAVTVVGTFPGKGDNYVGLTIHKQPEAGAPASLEDVVVTGFDDDSCTGTVSFDIPSTSFGGDALSGDVTYHIVVNDTEVVTASAAPGTSVEKTLTLEPGNTRILVYLSNDAGRSEYFINGLWVGYDSPIAVGDLSLDADLSTGAVNVTWTATIEGVHDGYVDPSLVTYDVIRHPDNVKVATGITDCSCSDNLPDGPYTGFYYEIIPYCSGHKGIVALTDVAHYGSAREVPYTESLTTYDSFCNFTVVDENKDGYTWVFDKKKNATYYQCRNGEMAKDLLISAPVSLKSDRVYKLSFKVVNDRINYEERIGLYLGEGEVISGYTQLGSYVKYTVGKDVVQEIRPTEDAAKQIAVRMYTITNRSNVTISDFALEEMSLLCAPDSVTGITIEAAPLGELKATVKFTTPATTIAGDELAAISKAVVMRDGSVEVAAVENPATGTEIEVADAGEGMESGMHTYTVVCYDDAGNAGFEHGEDGYVGIDTPLALTNVKVKDNGNNTLTMSWNKVADKGVHGGYVPADNAIYTIYDENGNALGQTVGTSAKLTLNSSVASMEPALIHLDVSATVDNKEGELASTNGLIIGKVTPAPFSERFPSEGESFDHTWWTEPYYNTFYFSRDFDFDGTGGSIAAYSDSSVAKESFNSVTISLSDMTNPILDFVLYCIPEKGGKLSVTVVDQDLNETLLGEISTSSTLKSKWQQIRYNLSQFKECRTIMLKFGVEFEDADGTQSLAIDDIKIHDALANDIAVLLDAPKAITVGETSDFGVTVLNMGTNAATTFDVNLYVNGKNVATVSKESMPALGNLELTIPYTGQVTDRDLVEAYAEIKYSADEDNANNTSAKAEIEVFQNELPCVTDLAGTIDENGNVTLTWSAPGGEATPVTEGFEDYVPWEINVAGNWTFVDGDGSWLSCMWSMPSNPCIGFGTTMGGVVYRTADFDNWGESYPDDDWQYGTHSGHQGLLMCGASDCDTDDWAISPQLCGDAQTVTMFVHSLSESDWECGGFEIRYSTTGTAVNDFTETVYTLSTVSVDWTEVSFDLPAGAKYFAIHYNAPMGENFALAFDDISYTPSALAATGFDIYFFDEKIGSVDGSTTTFTTDKGMGDYYVAAIYGERTSGLSNVADITTTAVEEIGNSSTTVVALTGKIVVKCTKAADVAVYNAAGALVAVGNGRDNYTISVAPGYYIVKVGNETFKRIVK